MGDGDTCFEAVIVGSGFGGSVMAERLAGANMRVCVLERGQPYPPGRFARTPHDMRHNFWNPRDGDYGLFDLWSFRHLDAVVSAGLGGGSLIYANVLIRKDEHWFVRDGYRGEAYEYWPVTRADLDPHYARVEEVLGAQVYPFDLPHFSSTPKTAAMQHAADKMCVERTTHDAVDPTRPQFYRPLLAISFGDGTEVAPGLPLPEDGFHGAPRQTCRLCGECDIGCNYGAKNTLDVTFLARAKRAGALIRTLTEVKSFRRRSGRPGYIVEYVAHDDSGEYRGRSPGRMRTIETDTLVLACGTLGTTFLMLRHNQRCGEVSPTLGTRFCGNGDVIDFSFSCSEPDAAGQPTPIPIDGSHGPVITSTFRFPDSNDNGTETGPGLYVQDAGYPLLLDWLIELANVPSELRRIERFASAAVRRWLGRGDSEIGGDIAALIGRGKLSSSSLALLGMGREEPDGVMRLDEPAGQRSRLDIDWDNVLAKPYFDRVIEKSRAIGRALGGRFALDPLMRVLNRLITVHPVGGCPMGRNSNEGVVDAYGEVFGHANLFIADGSVMPGPVGPNPSLTIAALADRTADRIVERRKGARAAP
jgi:cholesterol oxidase